MSISGTLSSALSGLTAAARGAQVVSSNIANATTEGYGVRSLNTSSRALGNSGAGVSVDGITRQIDPILLGQRRSADASLGHAQVGADAAARIEGLIGTPDAAGSLSDRIARFEAALVSAANSPESTARLDAAVEAAGGVATKLNDVSRGIQALRLEADRGIAQDVATLNESLRQVADLNGMIRARSARGDASALMDQRQALIDKIAAIVPLRQTDRPGGTVALYTASGIPLVDGPAAEFGFSPVGVMVPEMQVGGALSGLTVNGRPVPLGTGVGALGDGRLAAQFTLRDETAVTAQSRLDAVARDLGERFQEAGVDPTLGSGDPALFTDAGAAIDPAAELGLAGRIAVNAAIDPARGGESRRLRDGIGAVSPGPVGASAQLQRLIDAAGAARPTASGGFGAVARTLSGLAGDFLTRQASDRQARESTLAFASASQTALKTEELAQGVDTDQQMQELLLLEQAYAANARVIEAAQTMIDTLTRI